MPNSITNESDGSVNWLISCYALFLGLLLQRRRKRSLPDNFFFLRAFPAPKFSASVRTIARSVDVAMRLLAKPGFWSSCVVRTLVMSRFLAPRQGLVLHVGFYSGLRTEDAVPVGHAWLTLDRKNISDLYFSDDGLQARTLQETMAIELDSLEKVHACK